LATEQSALISPYPYHVWRNILIVEEAPTLIGPLRSIAMLLANVVVPTMDGAAYRGALVTAEGRFEWVCSHRHGGILAANKCSRDKWFEVHG
jgi:hypothetical protein